MLILSITVIVLSIQEAKKIQELKNHHISEWKRIPCILCYQGKHLNSFKQRFRVSFDLFYPDKGGKY